MDAVMFKEKLNNGEIKKVEGVKDLYIDKHGMAYKDNGVKRTTTKSPRGFRTTNVVKDNDKRTNLVLHTLIALYFIVNDGTLKGRTIKFKDGDKFNATFDNIEVIDKSDKRKGPKIKVLEYTLPDGSTRTVYEAGYLTNEEVTKFIKDGSLRPIENTPGYFIHENGFVINETYDVLGTFPSQDGYRRISLKSKRHTEPGSKKLKHVNFTMHLLVAQGFLEPYTYSNGDKTINHIDGNRINNNAENLEWISFKDNINHAHDTGLVRSSAKIKVYDIKLDDTIYLRSLRALSRLLNLPVRAFVGRIAHSDKYPILKRYVVSIENMDEFEEMSKGNSEPVYIHDYTTGISKRYASLHKAQLILGFGNTSRNETSWVLVDESPITDSMKKLVGKEQALLNKESYIKEPILTEKVK